MGQPAIELKGFLIIDVDRDVAHEYNRGYDLDHGTELIWQPGVIRTRRYHATPELIAQRVSSELPELGGGPGELLSLYWLGGDEDLGTTRGRIPATLGADGPIAREAGCSGATRSEFATPRPSGAWASTAERSPSRSRRSLTLDTWACT